MKTHTRQKRALIRLLYRRGRSSRRDIADFLSVSLATVSGIVRALLDEGILVEADFLASRGGRRAAVIALNPQLACAIGAEVSYRRIAAARVDLAGEILDRRVTVDLRPEREAALRAIAEAVTALLPEDQRRLAGIGIGVSGIVRESDLVSRRRPGAEAWEDVPLAGWLEKRVGVRPLVLNDVSAAALGEHRFGGWDEAPNMVCLHMGPGIAAGIIARGELYRGATGNAGEIGHTAVQDNGPICYCGNRGCLETFASPDAIIRKYAEAVGRNGMHTGRAIDITDIFDAALEGDRFACTVLEEAGNDLGRAAANLVNILNPSLMILGGDLARSRGPLVSTLKRVLESRILPALRGTVEVQISRLGEDACVLGAATAAMNRFFESFASFESFEEGRTEEPAPNRKGDVA